MLNLLTAMCDPCQMDNCITCTTFANDYSLPVCVEASLRAGLDRALCIKGSAGVLGCQPAGSLLYKAVPIIIESINTQWKLRRVSYDLIAPWLLLFPLLFSAPKALKWMPRASARR
jgi:hypothetical protein